MKQAKAVGKMALIYLLDAGLLQTFNLSKTQYLQNTIKQSAIKRAMPVYRVGLPYL